MGQWFSSLADWLLAVIMTVIVYSLSHSGTAVSALTLARLAPYALVLPWSGVLLDRSDTRLLMAAAGYGRAMCMVGLFFVQSSSALPLGYALIFLSSSLSCLLRPAVNATLPRLAEERDLLEANSLVTQLDGLAHIAGPAAGAVFILFHDPHLALLVTAAAFALSGLSFFLAPLGPRRTSMAASVDLSIGEVLAGFRFLLRENEGVLIALTATAAGLALLAGAYYVLAVVLCSTAFHIGGQGVGWLDAAYGVGGLVGSLIIAAVLRGRRVAHLFAGGAALSACTALLLAASPPGPAPFVCVAVVGIAAVVVQVTATTIIQAAAPGEMLGRTFTAFEASLVVAMLTGATSAGPLIRLVGPRPATAVYGLIGVALLLAAMPRLLALEDALGIRVFLRGVPLLAGLPRTLLDEIAPHFVEVAVEAGIDILREGEVGDTLYIIRSGEVEVLIGGRVVRRLGPAGYFGEVALLHDVPRTASVRSRVRTQMYCLDRRAFGHLTARAHDLRERFAGEAATYQLPAAVSMLLRH